MLDDLVRVVVVLGTVGGAIYLIRGRTTRRPRTNRAQLVRVPGQVISQHRFTLRWTIRYPLPDGSSSEFLVERTLPEHLREGMAVSVLVDPADPRRARLDMPQRTAFIRAILFGVAAMVVTPLVLFVVVAVLLKG